MKNAHVATSPNEPYILLVDDNRDGLIARRAVLEETGYRVQTARNAKEALELLCSTCFDLIVTDYKMPGMTGTELIQKIREDRPEALIILLSGFVDPLGLNEKTTGADTVISKSANEVPQLVRSVSRLLNRRAKERTVPRKPPLSQPPVQKTKAGAR